MADGRMEHEWQMAAAIQCVIANVGNYVFAKNPKSYESHEFNPMSKPQKRATIPGGMNALKAMVLKKKKP